VHDTLWSLLLFVAVTQAAREGGAQRRVRLVPPLPEHDLHAEGVVRQARRAFAEARALGFPLVPTRIQVLKGRAVGNKALRRSIFATTISCDMTRDCVSERVSLGSSGVKPCACGTVGVPVSLEHSLSS